MLGSILVRMPEITRRYSRYFGVKIINKYFVRVKGDVYIPLFNLPLLQPKIFPKIDCYKIASKLTDITFNYYKKYLELRKRKRFEISVYLPEKHGGHTLYYILQKFMIGEATPEEIEIVSEFLSREIFDGKNIDMKTLLYQYYISTCMYDIFDMNTLVNTPVGDTPLYFSDFILHYHYNILSTLLRDYKDVAFVNILTSHFFGKSAQIGSLKFNLLKSFGELDFNWKNVKVVSFKELYDISDAIIENNLKMAYPGVCDWACRDYYHTSMFLSHSPILSVVGNAIDFKNKSVMFLFAMFKRKYDNNRLYLFNRLDYLNDKNIEFFVVSVPFKNIKKFIFREGVNSGIFIIEKDGKTLPVLSTEVEYYWFGVGRENFVKDYEDYDWWYGWLRRLASPEHLEKAKEKTREWLKSRRVYSSVPFE